MAFTLRTYRRPFTAAGLPHEVEIEVRTDLLRSTLLRGKEVIAADETPTEGPEAARNHRLVDTLPSGARLEVEAGYVGIWSVGIRAWLDGAIVHESHPGRAIRYPAALQGITKEDPDYDPGTFRRNRVPIAVDVGLGLVFFLVGWFADLTTAAIVGAVLGLLLVIAQRFTKADLLGGLALFGTLMLLASAGLALLIDSPMAVQLRTTILGTISGLLFLADGLAGGKRLGGGLARYLAYRDLDLKRLSIGVGAVTLALAAINLVVALAVSERLWLVYSTFLDIPLVFAGFLYVIRRARRGGMPADAQEDPGRG